MPNNERSKGGKRAQEKIIGIAEVAAIAGVSSSAVGNWRRRYASKGDPFPKPLTNLATGPVFDRDAVVAWLERNEKIASTPNGPINLGWKVVQG